MRILYNLQLSSRTKNLKKYNVCTDSNYNVAINFIKGLNISDKNIQHYILIPKQSVISEYQNIKNLKIIKYDGCVDVFSNRVHFNVNKMKKILLTIKPDWIFENDPCKSYNWKLIIEENKLDIRIISYNHWLCTYRDMKVPENISYNIRQTESFLRSDICLVNSNFAINEFKLGCKEYFNNSVWHRIKNKIYKLQPLVNIDEINKYKVDKNEKLTIIYNHRLSSLPQYQIPFQKFIEICKKLYKKYDFDVILTNPSNKKVKKYKFIKEVGSFSLEEYYKKLWQSHVVVALFSYKGHWSISLVDAIMCECATLIPNHSGYKEIVNRNYKGFIDDNNVEKLLEKCIINEEFRNGLIKSAKKYVVENHNLEKVEKLYKLMEEKKV